MTFKTTEQLREILTEKDVFQRLGEVDIDKYDILLNSGLIDLGQVLETDQRLIENMEYVNEHLKMLNIKKITTNFIVEDIQDGLLYPEFDIVVYLNTIMMIQRYNNLYKILKSSSDIDTRKRLYTRMESCSHSREIHNMLLDLDKKSYVLFNNK